MKNTNFYQPKKNAHNDRKRHWFKYVGDSYLGFVSGNRYSYKCISAATGIKQESLRTRLRDENIDKKDGSEWVVTRFTLRTPQERAFAKPKQANKTDKNRALQINRCESKSEILSNKWLKVKL
jgi:hypothetical protein